MGIVTSCIRDCFANNGDASTAPASSLSQEDHATLLYWEKNGRPLNRALERDDADRAMVARVDAAFAKLQPFRGIIYRNMEFHGSTKGGGDTFSMEEAADRFVPGKTYSFESYSSGTPDPKIARNNNSRFGLDVALAIKTSTAADLRPVATMPEQSEVVLARGKSLTVTEVHTSAQSPSGSSRGRSSERRFAVLAHTPNSSPVRTSQVDPEWFDWARLSKEDATRRGMQGIPDDDEGPIKFKKAGSFLTSES
jgi:ADP-ribosyltransferase exoenzyme